MRNFRVFIYADGQVLPLVVPVNCATDCLTDRLQRILALDLIARRAEVWEGPDLVFQVDAGGIAALLRISRQEEVSGDELLTRH